MKKKLLIGILTIGLIDSIIGLYLYNLNELTYILCLLNSIILIITIWLSNNNQLMINYLILLGLIIYIGFSTYNYLIWYISFELIIIPMIYLISKGSGSLISKSRAIYRFTIYSLLGGLILIIILLVMYIEIGSLNYYCLCLNNLNYNFQIILFSLGLIPYFIKLPIFPFHIWLPDTHGEASTNGSIYLAAILLKLGGLGLIRWLIPIFPIGYLYIRPILLIISIISTIYASIISLRHIDLKKLIAYSSIAHMGLILLSLVNLNSISIYGFNFLLFSHGLVSANLFLLIGIIYVRTNTRYIFYYKGLASYLPLFSIFLLINLLFNSSFPPSLSFWAELHILISQLNYDIIGLFHILIALLFTGFYSILLFIRICFSFLNLPLTFKDLTLTEFYSLILLTLLSLSLPFIF